LVIFNFYLIHIKELTYKSEDLLQNWAGIGNETGEEKIESEGKNKRAIEIALASRLVTIQN
jgi:hypothetical protein